MSPRARPAAVAAEPRALRIPIPWRFAPRSYQVPVWQAYARDIKRFMIVAHRRSGKDKNLVNFTCARMMERVGLYVYMYPFGNQARKALWNGMGLDGMRYMAHFPDELVADRNETEMRVTLKNGSIFQIIGADNYDSMRSTNPLGVVFSEYPDMDPRVWSTVRPILKENGGWAAFIFTPRGSDHAKELWDMARAHPERWFTQLLTIHDTKRDAPGEDGLPIMTHDEYLAEISEGMDAEMAQAEYLCSFAASTIGSFYGSTLARHADHVREVPWDPALPVVTAFDLGLNDQTVVWCAQLPHGPEGPIHLIDYLAGRQRPITEYVADLKAKPYVYAQHVLPHDGAQLVGALEDLGLRPTVALPKTQSIINDVARVRAVLARCFFNKSRVMDGYSALQNYRKTFDAVKNTYSDTPYHNWASDAADAFRMLVVALDAGLFDDPDHADRARYRTADNSNWSGYSELDALHEARDHGDHESEDSYQPWERSRFRY